MADGDESLLDVFVNIRPDPAFQDIIRASANAAIDEYTRIFSSATLPSPTVRPPNVSGGATGGGGGGNSGGGGSTATQAANDLRNQLRQVILEFQRDKAFLEVDVRIANDKDLQLRLKNLTSEVAGQANLFRTTDDEDEQLKALIRIIDLREQDLALLRQATAERIRAAGLGASTFDRSESFREQRDAVESSLLGVKGVGKTINASGDSDIIRQFRVLNEQLDAAKLKLSQGLRAENLIDVTDARERIQRLADEVDSLRIKAQSKIVVDLQIQADQTALKEQFDQAAAYAKDEIARASIKNKLESSLLRGLPSAELRREIAGVNAQLEESVYNVNRLSRGFDGTKDSVERLNQATDRFKEVNVNLSEVRNRASESSQSMNTLTNNAYQLGQAFEDFSVGFSLNGIAGGIRGAANNVAFLLNDLSRMPAVQNSIGEKFARWLPLVAGIGSAVAITVVPALIEWLESLNDIESKFEDISDILSEDFSRVEFNVGLGIERTDFLRSIQNAKELRDIVKQLADQVQNAEDKGTTIKGIFEGIDETGNLSKVLNQLREFDVLLKSRERLLEIRVDNASTSGSSSSVFKGFGAFGLGASTSDFLANAAKDELEILQPVIQKTAVVYNGLRKAREDGISGTANQVQLRQTIDGFNELLKVVEKTAESFDLSDSDAGKNLIAVLSEMKSEIASLEKTAAEMESFSKSVAEGLDAAQKKVKELSQAQDIIRRQINGTASDQALYVYEVTKTSEAYSDLIEKVREFDSITARKLGLDTAAIDSRADSLQEALRFQTENELLLKRKEIIEKIDSIKEKDSKRGGASITNIDAYISSLQKNALSNPVDKNTTALERLTDELNDIQSGLFGLRSQRKVDGDIDAAVRTLPIGGGVGAGAMEFMMRAEMQSREKGRPDDIADAVNRGVKDAMQGFVAPVVGEQKNTTEAVRGIKAGAVAR